MNLHTCVLQIYFMKCTFRLGPIKHELDVEIFLWGLYLYVGIKSAEDMFVKITPIQLIVIILIVKIWCWKKRAWCLRKDEGDGGVKMNWNGEAWGDEHS